PHLLAGRDFPESQRRVRAAGNQELAVPAEREIHDRGRRDLPAAQLLAVGDVVQAQRLLHLVAVGAVGFQRDQGCAVGGEPGREREGIRLRDPEADLRARGRLPLCADVFGPLGAELPFRERLARGQVQATDPPPAFLHQRQGLAVGRKGAVAGGAAERLADFPGGHVEQAELAAVVEGQRLAVGREGEPAAGGALKAVDLLAGRRVPEAEGAAAADRREELAVRGARGRAECAVVLQPGGADAEERTQRQRIPDAVDPRPLRAGDALPVRSPPARDLLLTLTRANAL